MPALTDVIENGRLPRSPRGWVTELVVGAVIAWLVHRVRRDHAAVLRLARHDELTTLPNRLAFGEEFARACARARRSKQPLALVYIDLDDFKAINDGAGHEVGDLALRRTADALVDELRRGVDLAFRLGGDEFAILLPDTGADAATTAVERLRAALRDGQPVWPGGPIALSAGIAELQPGEDDAGFLRRADTAMYLSKRARRG